MTERVMSNEYLTNLASSLIGRHWEVSGDFLLVRGPVKSAEVSDGMITVTLGWFAQDTTGKGTWNKVKCPGPFRLTPYDARSMLYGSLPEGPLGFAYFLPEGDVIEEPKDNNRKTKKALI